jgi:1-piperideine-2-carboxylate/1-pyrroline-2-carboxylate reductase [NAD(P)H]
MLVLNETETARRLPYPKLTDSIRAVLLEKKAGRTVAPERSRLELPGGVLLLMPATDGRVAVTKLVSVHGDNAAHGLPSIQGEVIVMRADTGERLMMLDGATVTARRTAAVSLLAAQRLAPNPSASGRHGPLLIVGAGTQGKSHLEAFTEGLGVREVFIHSRNPASAARLVRHARHLGFEAHLVEDMRAALAACPLIVTATNATAPVIPNTVRDDVFIAAVGAFRLDMIELPNDLVRRSRLFVDTLEGARHEAGDYAQAGVDWETVTPLEEALEMPGIPSGPIVFKSIGHALWDLAAARCALES